MLELLAVDLPKTLQFLQPGWFVLHLTAIPLVFVLGMALGRRGMGSRVTGYGTTGPTGTTGTGY